jgi:hypothetical protein
MTETPLLFQKGKVQQFRFNEKLCSDLNNHAAIIHSESKTDVLNSYIDSLKRKQTATPPQSTPQTALPNYPAIKETVFCRYKGCLVTKESCREFQKSPKFATACATVKNPICKEIV